MDRQRSLGGLIGLALTFAVAVLLAMLRLAEDARIQQGTIALEFEPHLNETDCMRFKRESEDRKREIPWKKGRN